MKEILAAIRSGTDPVGPLPPASFHHWLEEQISCPKCSATYNLIVDFDWYNTRHFERESAQLIRMLRKAVMLGHTTDHRVTHFETAGVVVKSYKKDEPPPLPPLPKHIM